MVEAKFGWIPHRIDINGNDISISTLPEFLENVDYVIDNYFYPPCVKYYKRNFINNTEKEIQNSQREAPLYLLRYTHKIKISKKNEKKDNHQFLEYIIQFLGFIYGYRTHRENNPTDSRTYTKSNSLHSCPQPTWFEKNFDIIIKFWKKLNKRDKIVFTNALFFHNRVKSYTWDWEQFSNEYQVFDALYKVAHNLYCLKAKSHSLRFDAACKKFNIYYDKNVLRTIVKLRNDIIHEALWDGNLPITKSIKGISYFNYLHKFNQRFGLAIMGFKGEYIKLPWNVPLEQKFNLD